MEQNNQLQVFNNEEFGQVRTTIINNEPWFVVKDVCSVLEIKNSRDALSRLDDDEKGVVSTDTLGGKQDLSIVNEAGLYTLVLGSRKPEAKRFKRWITHDIIPSIRKHGAYMTEQTIEKVLTDPDFIIQLATQLKDEKAKRLEVEKQIEEQKPLVTFAETCLKSSDNILVRQLSKIANDEGIEIGEKRLYTKLREWGLIMKHSTEPYQYGMDREWFVVEENNVKTPYGVKLSKTTKVTPKGQVYIIERLKKEFK